MSKQLILITAPFNCGHCARALKELPTICEEQGYELVEIKNEKGSEDNLPVDMYPTVMVRINEKIENTMKGYNPNKILTELKEH